MRWERNYNKSLTVKESRRIDFKVTKVEALCRRGLVLLFTCGPSPAVQGVQNLFLDDMRVRMVAEAFGWVLNSFARVLFQPCELGLADGGAAPSNTFPSMALFEAEKFREMRITSDKMWLVMLLYAQHRPKGQRISSKENHNESDDCWTNMFVENWVECFCHHPTWESCWGTSQAWCIDSIDALRDAKGPWSPCSMAISCNLRYHIRCWQACFLVVERFMSGCAQGTNRGFLVFKSSNNTFFLSTHCRPPNWTAVARLRFTVAKTLVVHW